MSSSRKSKTIRSLMHGGAVIAAIAAIAPAQAATIVSGPSNIVVTGTPTRCIVSFNYVFQFTQADIGPDDYVYGTVSAPGFSITQLATGISSGTGTGSHSFQMDPAFITGGTLTSGLTVLVQDRLPNGSTTNLASSPISTATLQSAGGACAQFIPNLPPTVTSPDQTTLVGQQVTMSAAANDPEGAPLSYQWFQLNGPTVTLNNANTPVASFTPTASAIYDFQVNVSDGRSTTAEPVRITVVTNQPPVVNAGVDATVPAGSPVSLTGTATDAENNPLTYQWSQTAGTSVTLSNPTTLTPSFTAPSKASNAQILTFNLVANDGTSNSAPDSVDITIPANVGPTADAGGTQTAGGGTQVTLNGTGSSDGDGDAITYQWTQLTGPTVTLNGATTATPSFTAPPSQPNAQVLTFGLVVSDGIDSSAQAVATVNVPTNAPPTVSAGPDVNATGGSPVMLTGTASDNENDPLTYQWTQTAGPSVSLSGATTLSPTLVAPAKTNAAQTLTFSLTANDGTSTSAPDSVDVIIAANAGPTANAGNGASVRGGATVALNGSGSTDGDGDTLTYNWTQLSGPAVTIANPTSANASFTAPIGLAANQQLRFRLTVSDGVDSATADVDFTVLPNSPPLANAGPDQGPVNTGQTVTLNGNGSSDPDGNTIAYQWTQVSGPAVTLINPTSATPSFVAPTVQGTQNLVFQLIVNDGQIASAPDTVTIAVRAVGSVTIIHRITGRDQAFSFTSSITALNGSLTTVNGVGQLVATLVPAGSHMVVAGDARAAGFAITAISCNDGDSVVNLASRSIALALSPHENLVCTFTSVNTRDAAQTAIADFLTARNAAILASQPSLQRRLDRLDGTVASAGSANAFGLPVPGSGHLPLNASLSHDALRASTSLAMTRAAFAEDGDSASPFDLWAEANFSTLRYPGHRGLFRLLYIGADYRIGDDVLVGALAQFDRFSPTGVRTAGTSGGDGWMAGPYVLARLAPQLYVDLRAAWGTSDNDVSPLGTYRDSFSTSRGLYTGALIGEFEAGTGTRFRPELRLRYLGEHQRAYVDALGVTIPAQDIGQGDISFSPRIDQSIALNPQWMMRPYLSAEGIYSFGIDQRASWLDQFRMRLEAGAELWSAAGFRFGLTGFHDGIGSDGFRNNGIRMTVGYGF